MSVPLPQADLPRRVSGASFAWDLQLTEELLELDYFPVVTSTTPLKIKVGGVFTALSASYVKVAGSMVAYTPKIKQGGSFA